MFTLSKNLSKLFLPLLVLPFMTLGLSGTANAQAVSVPSSAASIPGLTTSLATDPTGPIVYATPSALKAYRASVAATRDGQSDTKIMFLGDSVTAGLGGSFDGSNTSFLGAFPRRLAQLFTLSGLPSSLGYIIAPVSGTPDARITAGSSWTATSFGPTGQSGYTATNATNALVFTPGIASGSVDSYDVYYITSPGAGVMTATASGGSATTITETTANGIGHTVVTGTASTSSALSISWTSGGAVYVLGVEPFLSTTKQVRMGLFGLPGQSATSWATTNTPNWSGANLITAYHPVLTVLCLGVNDSNSGNNVTAANYATNMQTLITAAAAQGSVIILTFPPTSASSFPSQAALETQYIPKLKALALANNCVLVDWWGRYGGVNDPTFMGAIHPSNVGYWDIAKVLYKGLQ